jgi:hypothetical protein
MKMEKLRIKIANKVGFIGDCSELPNEIKGYTATEVTECTKSMIEKGEIEEVSVYMSGLGIRHNYRICEELHKEISSQVPNINMRPCE